MIVRVNRLALFAMVACTGCAIHRPLMVSDQAKLVRAQAKALNSYAEPVQNTLKGSGSVAALVIVDQDPSKPPAIYPTHDPVATALDHHDQASRGSSCFVVYIRTLPLVPEQLSCALLTNRANDLSESRKTESEQTANLTKLNSDLGTLRSDLSILQSTVTSLGAQAATLSEEVKQQQAQLESQEKAVTLNGKDMATLAKVLAPTTKLVKFHEEQLQSTEKMLDTLIEQYSKTAVAVGQNNQQIESMIKDLNTSFAQVKATLDQMQQKLATVK